MIIDEKLPQILLLSSRTEAGIEQILHQTEVTKITPEFAGLLNGVFWREVKNHMHRGYTVVSAKGINAPRKVKVYETSSSKFVKFIEWATIIMPIEYI